MDIQHFGYIKLRYYQKGDGIYVYFDCTNLDEQVEKLKLMGISFDQDLTNQSWLWKEASIKDLDGNQLILFIIEKTDSTHLE